MHTHFWPAWALLSVVTGLRASLPQLALASVGFSLAGLASRRCRGFCLLLVAGLWLGAARHQLTDHQDPWRDLDGLRMDVSGTVLGHVRSRPHSLSFLLAAERIEGRPELGAAPVWVVWHADAGEQPQPLSGERWRLRGRLKAPRDPAYPGDFDERGWLARHGIHHQLHGWERHDSLERLAPPRGRGLRACAWKLRARLLEGLEVGLSPRQHALLCGVVLGETQFLDPADEENFRATGTSHLLAASGLNVALMVTLVVWLGRRAGFGPGRSALPALAVAAFYALLAEASPSVVRAAVMAAVSLLAMATGRISGILHSLTLASLVCVLADPAYLHDLGFQMSVLAVLSLVWLEPGCARRLEGLPSPLRRGLAATLAATLGLLPWMVWNFQQWAPATILANLVMAPVAELLLPLGLLQAGLQSLGLAAPLARCNAFLLDYLLGAAACLAGWFGPGHIARPDLCQTAGLTLMVALTALWLYGRLDFRMLLFADVLLLLLWWPRAGPPELCVRVARPLAWVRFPGRGNVALAPEASLGRAARMLRVNGAWPDRAHPVEAALALRRGGASLDCRAGSCRLAHGRCRLLIVWKDPPAEHALPVDVLIAERRHVACQLWLRGEEPVEVRSDGRRVRVIRWKGANGRP